jgi:hypothetical protein
VPVAITIGLVAISGLAVLVPPLAVPGVVLALILSLSFPKTTGRIHTFGHVAMGLAALGCVLGLGRFAMSKAMLGIVEGGQSAAAHSALWRLREVVIAEDALRRGAEWDPDGDHVGSAALIESLTGALPLRPGGPKRTPLLNYAFGKTMDTPLGPAAFVEGYLIVVCLPTTSGGFTARPGDAVDDERAERRYVAYAWPSESAAGMKTAFFTDEHERILVLDPAPTVPAPYLGASRAPACDAAIDGKDGLPWVPWKNKKPRERLPGE